MCFDIAEQLCKRYPALSPFAVRRERCGEVFKLVKRINAYNARVKGAKRGETVYTDAKGNMHIRRKASDNNIF